MTENDLSIRFRSRALIWKLIVFQLVKKSPTLYGTRRLLQCLQQPDAGLCL